jgi:hypothetical protein
VTFTQQSLFGVQTNSEKVARRKSYRQRTEARECLSPAVFETWWDTFPSRQGKGKGPKPVALEVWLELTDKGVPYLTLERQLANYREARDMFRVETGEQPPVMMAATFLRSKRHRYNEPWTLQMALEHWSASLPQAETWNTQYAIAWKLWKSGGFDALIARGKEEGLSVRSFRAFSSIAGQLSTMAERNIPFAFRDAWQSHG